MTLAVLLTGSPSMAHGRGRQGGRAAGRCRRSKIQLLAKMRPGLRKFSTTAGKSGKMKPQGKKEWREFRLHLDLEPDELEEYTQENVLPVIPYLEFTA